MIVMPLLSSLTPNNSIGQRFDLIVAFGVIVLWAGKSMVAFYELDMSGPWSDL